MKKLTMFGELCFCLCGPRGVLLTRIPDYTELLDIIFAEQNTEYIHRTVKRKYMSSLRLPQWARDAYAGDDGLAKACTVGWKIANIYCSYQLMTAIQARVHEWLQTCVMEKSDRALLSANYVAVAPSKDAIGTYIGNVLYYVILHS